MLSVVADTPQQDTATFEDFWLLYPKRVARKDALKAWQRLTDADRMRALTALVDWRRVWAHKELQYVPNAATWINGERFYDELPVDMSPRPAAQAPAKLAEAGERSVMPDKVRDALAKMRGR